MSRPRFLADHDFKELIVRGVLRREPTIHVVRAREAGLHNRPDDEVLDFAAREGLIVVSHDVRTMTAAAYRRVDLRMPMAGLLLARQRQATRAVTESLVLIWAASDAEDWRDHVRYLPL